MSDLPPRPVPPHTPGWALAAPEPPERVWISRFDPTAERGTIGSIQYAQRDWSIYSGEPHVEYVRADLVQREIEQALRWADQHENQGWTTAWLMVAAGLEALGFPRPICGHPTRIPGVADDHDRCAVCMEELPLERPRV